ncbi:uncharacterized protein J4E84_010430 [Alternaria hordeiaustralica]|uniref:uncharacterized protein n=1 Tax=Alternaria hordeiaustralica TaxID=1187925 RepID=UPI0020C55F69|nr:uncharacterized protein J4E84_010430 [Alternaria hordeiaustralica]KAI4674689.1 hypothetical protein J4E84_010430 [Alternaria hordeiaustralica]
MASHDIVSRGEADFDLYPYTPSAGAGYTFLILFAIGGLTHLIMLIPLRSWFFIPFVLGCVGEAAGYYGRAWSSQNIRQGSPYLLQLMLILAAAPLLAATIYMTLGRLIRSLDATHHAVMNPRWTTKIYVIIDIGSFVCQIMGSAMQASGDPDGVKTGTTVVIAGLGTQLVAFGFFILMAVVFHRRLNNEPTSTSRRTHVKWRRYMWALYSVSVLVVVRSIFRLAEFVEGPESKVYQTEAYLYVFDAALMFAVVVIMAVFHPGFLFRVVRKAELMPLSDDEGNGSYLLRGDGPSSYTPPYPNQYYSSLPPRPQDAAFNSPVQSSVKAFNVPVSDHTLEYRILELLQPFRDTSSLLNATNEAKNVLLLAQNIASIIVSKQSKDLSKAGITDVYIMSRNLNTTAVNGTAASGPAYLRIFFHIDYQSITVVKAKIENGKNAIGALIDEVDKVIESLMEDS